MTKTFLLGLIMYCMKILKFVLKICFNFLYLLDLVLNTILLGDPSETVSSRLGRAIQSGRPKWFVYPFAKVVDFIFYKFIGERNHSLYHIEYDENYKHELWSWINGR